MPLLTVDIEKGLIAGAFGLAGTLIPVIVSWSRDRDIASARLRKLEEATKRVVFWDQWLKLSCQVQTPSAPECLQRVQKELDLLRDIIEGDALFAHAQMSKQQDRKSQFTGRILALPFLRRLFLLYKPERTLAWFPRFLFYTGIATLIVVALAQIQDKSNLEGFLIVELMLLVWIVVFRYLSRWLEEPHGSALTVPVSFPPPPKP